MSIKIVEAVGWAGWTVSAKIYEYDLSNEAISMILKVADN